MDWFSVSHICARKTYYLMKGKLVPVVVDRPGHCLPVSVGVRPGAFKQLCSGFAQMYTEVSLLQAFLSALQCLNISHISDL